MPGLLTLSPADVVRQLLIDLSAGSEPNGDPWPIFASFEPDKPEVPDNIVTVYDTLGTISGRTHTDGETQEHHGIQVRVRSDSPVAGYAKAREIADKLDKQVLRTLVTIIIGGFGFAWRVQSVTRTSDVIALGKEIPTSHRNVFVVNAIVSLRETT